MISIRSRLGKSVSVMHYLLASAIPLVLNVATNPLVAMNMSPEDYAIVGYYKSFNTLISPLVLFYVLQYYMKRYYETSEDKRLELKATVFKFLTRVSFLIAVLCLLPLFVYHIFFANDGQIPFFPYAILCVMSLPLSGAILLTKVEYRMSSKSLTFLKISALHGIMTIFYLMLLVVVFKGGAFGNLLSVVLAELTISILAIYINRDLLKIAINRELFWKMVRFCAPLAVAAMLGFFSNGFDRVFLERLNDIKELGYYVVGVSIAGYLRVFSDALSNTFEPDIYRAVASRQLHVWLKYTSVIIVANVFIVLLFVLLSPYILYLLTAGRYMTSLPYIQIVAWASVTSCMYFSVSQLTVALGLTGVTFWVKLLGSIATVGIFILFINQWQFVGASWGLVVSHLVTLLLNLLILTINKQKILALWRILQS